MLPASMAALSVPKFIGAAAAMGGAQQLTGQFVNQKLGPALGIPTPGEQQQQFHNQAYPGTTPWERLGSPSSGAQAQAASQQKVASTQAAASVTAARTQASAQRFSAAAQSGIEALKADVPLDKWSKYLSGLSTGGGMKSGIATADVNLKTAQAADLVAAAKLKGAQAASVSAQIAPLVAKFKAEALKYGQEAKYRPYQNLYSTIFEIASGVHRSGVFPKTAKRIMEAYPGASSTAAELALRILSVIKSKASDVFQPRDPLAAVRNREAGRRREQARARRGRRRQLVRGQRF